MALVVATTVVAASDVAEASVISAVVLTAASDVAKASVVSAVVLTAVDAGAACGDGRISYPFIGWALQEGTNSGKTHTVAAHSHTAAALDRTARPVTAPHPETTHGSADDAMASL